MEDKQVAVGEVTFDQALALVEAMVGYISFSEESGAPRSPHVVTHLEAVLGSHNLPSLYECYGSFRDCANKADTARRNPAYRSDCANRDAESSVPAFISYFKGCVQVLCAKLGVPVDMGTTFPAATVTVEQALALIESMVGVRVAEGMHDGYAIALSPYCVTHFDAVLGRGCVPVPHYLFTDVSRTEAVAFLAYLARVVRALDDALALPPEEAEGGRTR